MTLVCLMLLAGLLLSLLSCGKTENPGSSSIVVTPFSPSDDEPLRVTDTTPRTTEPSVTTAELVPETTKAETTAPETTAPETEPEPVDPAAGVIGRNLSMSGRINPKGSHNLEIHLEWTATQKADSPYATVVIKVFLDSYDVYIYKRDDCKLTVNGEETIFSTDIIDKTRTNLQSTELYKKTYQIISPLGERVEIPVSAAFRYGAAYGKDTYDWLTAEGTIVLSDVGSVKPEAPLT